MRFPPFVLCVSLLVACDCSSTPPVGCVTNTDCASGEICIDGRCEQPVPDAGTDTSTDALADTALPDTSMDASSCDSPCGTECCEGSDICYLDSACIPDVGECTTNDECNSDTYCAVDGICVPFGVPEGTDRNEECVLDIDIEAITPALQCSFTEAPPEDPFPGAVDLRGTPVVIDFDLDNNPDTLRPSIVVQTFGPAGGEVLRVIDGNDCSLQHTIVSGLVQASAPALGDLNMDGRADIVVNVGGVVTTYSYDVATEAFVELWRGATCEGETRTPHTANAREGHSASLHDLDDDGLAEVIIGGSIYDNEGCLRATVAGSASAFDRFPVVADVDEDGLPEIVSSSGIYAFDGATNTITPEPYFAGDTSGGSFPFAAVGDFGVHPLAAFGGEDRAEIVVVGDGEMHIETIEGTRLLTAALPSGRGGPPTVADFDGDGRAEVAAAARTEYVVFDLDCLAGGDAEGCGGMARTDGRLWSVMVQETSSGITGSSVFDFDADGVAEVIYHDECFLRVFRGTDGEVLYSFPRSSLTWFEMPVVADTDGDFHSEIVVGAHNYNGSCPAADPYRPEATFMQTSGVYVLRDELDRWAASRPIWNQHAYSITHVGNRGELPRTSEVAINWREDGLNNFRQNVQGDLEALGIADLTTSVRGVTPLQCRDDMAIVSARVCNRGRLPLGGGLIVALREGDLDGEELCRTTIDAPVGTGECVDIQCSTVAPTMPIDIYVVPDPDDLIDECHEDNSWGRLLDVNCSPLI